MLSTELTKLKDETHLKAFLQRVNAPHSIPKGSPEESKFKQTVLDRLEQRALESKQLSDKTIRSGAGSFVTSSGCLKDCHTPSCTCCNRLKGRKSGWSGSDPEIVWRRLECKNLETFESYITTAIESNMNIIRCLKAMNMSLTFWEDPRPEWEGLSVMGCYGWILSFSLQHLMDEDDPKDPTLLKGLEQIRELYTEMAQSSELFLDMVEAFYAHSHRLRDDAIYTTKKLVKKWKITDKNPFLERPEKSEVLREPDRRLGSGVLDKELDVSSFHLNWTPLMVMIRSTRLLHLGWHEYGGLILLEKLHWFKVFIQYTVDRLQLAADDMHMICGQLSGIRVNEGGGGGGEGVKEGGEEGSTNFKSHAREISGALMRYSKVAKWPISKNGKSGRGRPPDEDERTYWTRLVCELWYSTDMLQTEALVLRRTVRETRDILRTCYVYADVFYKLGLPSYDEFLSKASKGQGGGGGGSGGGRKKGSRPGQTGTIRGAWDKFVSKEGRKLSDIAEMLVMSDFSTSIYQRVLEYRPVEAEDMVMKLDSHTLDDNQKSGLVSGMSVKRKSGKK